MVLRAALIGLACLTGVTQPGRAHGQDATTRDALDRMEEILSSRLEDGTLDRSTLRPMLIVSTAVHFESSLTWFPTEVLSVLTRILGADSLRLCEACMKPRVFVSEGYVEQGSGPVDLSEIIRLEELGRGEAEPARTGIWVDEQASGVSVKIVELSSSRILWAENVDPVLRERRDTETALRLSEELDRRARGDSITQLFFDVGVYPDQHISLEWTDQWGETNANLTGFVVSAFDPIFGVGAVYHRAIDLGTVAGFRFAPTIGAKVLISLPTALVESVGGDLDDFIDPVVTGVGVIRVPIGRSNYGLMFTASTSGRFAFGISLLNISLLPIVL